MFTPFPADMDRIILYDWYDEAILAPNEGITINVSEIQCAIDRIGQENNAQK